jgi:hypothetical protein
MGCVRPPFSLSSHGGKGVPARWSSSVGANTYPVAGVPALVLAEWTAVRVCVYAVPVLRWQSVPSFLQHTQLPLRVRGAEEFVDELEFFLGIRPL